MNVEPTPIETFVHHKFSHKLILAIIDKWRVEPSELQRICISHFREMGFYMVRPTQERVVMEAMMEHLKCSPDILRLVKKAENAELARRQSRHAD